MSKSSTKKKPTKKPAKKKALLKELPIPVGITELDKSLIDSVNKQVYDLTEALTTSKGKNKILLNQIVELEEEIRELKLLNRIAINVEGNLINFIEEEE